MTQLGCIQSKFKHHNRSYDHSGKKLKRKPHIGAVAVLGDMAVEATEECAIPNYGAVKNFELPNCTKIAFSGVINQYKTCFVTYQGRQVTQAYTTTFPQKDSLLVSYQEESQSTIITKLNAR